MHGFLKAGAATNSARGLARPRTLARPYHRRGVFIMSIRFHRRPGV